MTYPSIENYHEAMQHPDTCMQDQELRRGKVPTTITGLPRVMCGGFALTYPMTCGNKKYAIRCFHKESNALQKRYQAIANKLKALKSPYFIDFDFQNDGIRIKQNKYPIVKMAWAQGTTLGEFLDCNHGDKANLQRLRLSLDQLSLHLDANGIAHGDIQTGNVLVNQDATELLLVDYDGMYVDDLKQLGSAEAGQRNFQHPDRIRLNPYDITLDRFSFILLNLAIRSLESDPSLWDKTKSDADGILFRANDFADPSSSPTLAYLWDNQAFGQDVKNFAAICASPYSKIPSLNDFKNNINIPLNIIRLVESIAPIKKKIYLPSNPVVKAQNYSQGLAHVGDQIELIGQITEVKSARTKYGKPYIFFNFGKWNDNIIKITIWSEGLSLMRQKPDKSWEGKWISVIGLMDPPYHSIRYKYTHLSITINQGNQISILTPEEANFRLGAIGSAFDGEFEGRSNRDLLSGMKTGSRNSSPAFQSQHQYRTKTDNQAILDKIRGSTHSPQRPLATKSPTPTVGPKSSDGGCIATSLGVAIGIATWILTKNFIAGLVAFFISFWIVHSITKK